MSNGSFQKYQHYLPATYIRRFRISQEENSGKNTVYGFVKINASSKQIKERISPLNATKICGQDLRHTIIVDGERDNIIEDAFKILEDIYPEFLHLLGSFFNIKGEFKTIFGRHYCVKKMHKFSAKDFKSVKNLTIVSAIYEVDSLDLKNISIFMARFMCYRNKKMDEYFSSSDKLKLKKINESIKEAFKTNKNLLTDGAVFSRSDWRTLLSIFKDGGFMITNSEKGQRNEILKAIKAFHRFMVLPFHSYLDESDCKAYLYAAPRNKPIVSGDFPFFFYKGGNSLIDGCIFTVSPAMALIFSSEELKTENHLNLSDLLSHENAQRAERYVFSNNKERLSLFTKGISQSIKESYGRKQNTIVKGK
ncbi:DUF4238 domain-containing protein [Pantoea deleyi]|uniref:DUF4238 domain-containing protein n=1 Tax=Pantoea deleyi TaxID=470932 RepID=UPI0035D52B5E